MAGGEFSAKSVGVAIACGIGAMISGASIVINSIPVLLLAIQTEFGWGRTAISGAIIPAAIAAGLVTPLVGRAVDRWGARIVVLIGVVAFGFATMAVSLTGASIVELYVLYGVFGLAGTAAGAVAFNKALSGWFHRRRGIVLALVGTGSAIGGAVVPEVTARLSEHFGWRGAYIGLGLVVLAIGVPVFGLLFRERTDVEHTGEAPVVADAPPAAVEAHEGLTVGQAMRTAPFWLVIGAICINTFVGFGLQFHVVALLTDRGMSFDDAVSVLSFFAVGGVAGQITAGFLLDRFNTPRIGVPFFASALAGLLLFDYGAGFPVLLAAGLLLRIGVGAELSMAPYFIARFFGLRSFGAIYGILYLAGTLTGGAGPLVMGFSSDHLGGYRPALLLFEGVMALSVLFIAILGPYVYAVAPPRHDGH